VRVNPVVPWLAPLASAGDTPMATPLAGLCEFTVNTYVVGGVVVVVLLPLPPPPHAEISTLSPLIQIAVFQPENLIAFLSSRVFRAVLNRFT
jgi:hypothetical protein